jgi:hypothetical protein
VEIKGTRSILDKYLQNQPTNSLGFYSFYFAKFGTRTPILDRFLMVLAWFSTQKGNWRVSSSEVARVALRDPSPSSNMGALMPKESQFQNLNMLSPHEQKMNIPESSNI